MNFLVFDKRTGEILRVGDAPYEMLALQGGAATEQVMVGAADDVTQYVDPDTWQVRDRPAMALQIGAGVVRNVPVPARLLIEGAWYDVTEPEVELEFDYPGTYRVRIEAFPYLPEEFDVENPA